MQQLGNTVQEQHCLPLLMDVYIEEIVGDVAQQKAVAVLAAKNKEARSSKACDMLELIGKQVAPAPPSPIIHAQKFGSNSAPPLPSPFRNP